ncbi:MAG: PE family protein [Mycobacterium sp.]|uniref:PE family protein n=1 Tax=Mycobacterium sp. TaxID=1785 RepID=UPI003C4739B6
MAYVIAAPEMIEAASTDLATIGSTLNTAHMSVAAPTVEVMPAAADEVSAGIAQLFSQHAHQALVQIALGNGNSLLGGIAFLSIFAVAIPFAIMLEILNMISLAITGQPI